MLHKKGGTVNFLLMTCYILEFWNWEILELARVYTQKEISQFQNFKMNLFLQSNLS
jgi:hypothetical protein